MPTKLFNRSPQALVPAGRWGEGVVMPGEFIEVDNPESYAPDHEGSPWTTDEEAANALLRLGGASAHDSSSAAPDGASGPGNAPQGHDDGPGVRVEANGDVVTDAGAVVGHVETAPAVQANQEG